jgi:hypothetical protein
MSTYAGFRAGTVEVPQIPDRFAAAQRTRIPGHFETWIAGGDPGRDAKKQTSRLAVHGAGDRHNV